MIRRIEEKDLAECAEVICRSFGTVAEEFGLTRENAPRFTAFATTIERLKWHLNGEKRLIYGYFDEEKVVGYYSIILQEEGVCEVNNLCVLPQYRHKGIGEVLLKDAFRAAAELGCNWFNIGIVEENQILRKWYEGFGFVHVGTEKFDFFPFTCGYMVKEL